MANPLNVLESVEQRAVFRFLLYKAEKQAKFYFCMTKHTEESVLTVEIVISG